MFNFEIDIFFFLIRNLCFLFTELNAGHNSGSSSGSGSGDGWHHPGGGHTPGNTLVPFTPRFVRSHDRMSNFMTHDVFLWLAEDRRTVVRASFEGMHPPYNFDRETNYLIRLDRIRGFSTVTYVRQNGRLLSVRAPNPHSKKAFQIYVTDFFPIFHSFPPPCEDI